MARVAMFLAIKVMYLYYNAHVLNKVVTQQVTNIFIYCYHTKYPLSPQNDELCLFSVINKPILIFSPQNQKF
jgi:hypothetical protein